jgi:hypothetical protein
VGLVGKDDHGMGGAQGNWPAGGGRCGVAASIGGEDRQVDRTAFALAHLVEARQEQEVLDEPLHPGRFLFDPPHDRFCAHASVVGA